MILQNKMYLLTTDPQTLCAQLQGFRGIAPFVTGTTVTCDPECAADGMSTAAQEMKGGLSWELAVAKAESATAVAATTKADAAIKTMAANAPTDPQTLLGFRGIAPSVTGTTVTCDPECAADGMSTAAQEMKGGLSWELAVGG